MNVIDYYMKRGREQLAKLAMEPGDFYHRTSEHCVIMKRDQDWHPLNLKMPSAK